jgi:uncharacterized caspase-like protein
VIGNDAYQKSRLFTCVNDATDLSNELSRIGFVVTTKVNLDHEAMETEMRSFSASIKTGDLVLFFFAGHGVQWEDQNFLIGCDEDRIDEAFDLKYRATYAQRFLEKISARNPSSIICLLDCFRDYWLPTDRRGLAHMKALADSVIFFASAPGTVAKDQVMNKRNGVFTHHLLRHIAKSSENVLSMMTDVIKGIANETHGTQMPYISSGLQEKQVHLVPPKWQEAQSTSVTPLMTQLSGSSNIHGTYCSLVAFLATVVF